MGWLRCAFRVIRADIVSQPLMQLLLTAVGALLPLYFSLKVRSSIPVPLGPLLRLTAFSRASFRFRFRVALLALLRFWYVASLVRQFWLCLPIIHVVCVCCCRCVVSGAELLAGRHAGRVCSHSALGEPKLPLAVLRVL